MGVEETGQGLRKQKLGKGIKGLAFVTLMTAGAIFNQIQVTNKFLSTKLRKQNVTRISFEARAEFLFASGRRYELEKYELDLTEKYWELKSWLEGLARERNEESNPPIFFNFDDYNLWTEKGDRTLAQWVWKFQLLIKRILRHRPYTNKMAKVPNNLNSSFLTPKAKDIFIGNLTMWYIGAFEERWLKEDRVFDCNTALLSERYRYLDTTCNLHRQEPKNWDTRMDMIVTWENANPIIDTQAQPPVTIPWFKYVMESPYILPVHLSRRQQFVVSYMESSMVPHKLMKWVYFDPLVRSKTQTTDYSYGKQKLAAIFVSNCQASNHRMEYVRKLQEYMQVDVIGKCGEDICPRENQAECMKVLSRDYFFYLAFENANCQDYVTEKFHSNALGNHVVPVALGAPRRYYKKNAPQNSYIHVEDFDGPADLSAYLQFVATSSKHYNRYFEWVGTGEMLPQMYWFCRLCEMLYYEESLPPRRPLPKHQWLPTTRIADNKEPMCLQRGKWYWDEAGRLNEP